jgi:hypothetical protein
MPDRGAALRFQVGIGNAGNPVVARFTARERLIVFALWALAPSAPAMRATFAEDAAHA